MTRLPFDSAPELYEEQAGDGSGLDPGARLALAREYGFPGWDELMAWSREACRAGSPVWQFERCVECVVDGDVATLQALLAAAPGLVHARSRRHGCTLLHYVGANGVEGYRLRTPPNAVAVAKALLEAGLEAGAEVDALADLYGGKCTTLSLLVSSVHPHRAGLQVALAETLVDYGAALEDKGEGHWTSPLMTALAFGYLETARALCRRGAQVRNLAAAAGLGLFAECSRLLPGAGAEDRHRALSLAAQMGHAEIVRLLLEAGEDPNRFNLPGNHGHSTPLHQAALGGHLEAVRVLVAGGGRLDVKDTVYEATPLGWAEHGGQSAVVEYLRSAGD